MSTLTIGSLITEKRFTFACYLLECLAGTAIGYYLYMVDPVLGLWTFISILLVLAPDRKDAIALAANRIKANLIGAGLGLCVFYFQPVRLFTISAGIVAAMIICQVLKLQEASRSALIALLIIVLHPPGQHFWDIAVERAGGVVTGCMIGVLLTFLFHSVVQRLRAYLYPQAQRKDSDVAGDRVHLDQQ